MPKTSTYTAEFKKIITSQYIFSGVRMALATVIPSIVLAYLGLLKEYFLFPLGTSLIGLTDMVGPFIRRRNSLILAVFSFFCVSLVASLLKDFPPIILLEIIIFGMFFTMLGVYGQRLAAVGGISLVVFSIFMDGQLLGDNVLKSVLTFTAGCAWFVLVFIIMLKLQPYKLAGQMIGENYLKLADYLKIKAKFYSQNPDFDAINKELISKQVIIKNLQEDTREIAFKTRTIVNESTTTSRLLMLMFLNAIDLFDKLIATDINYKKTHEQFGNHKIISNIYHYLIDLADELTSIGIALQSGRKATQKSHISEKLHQLHQEYFELRNQKLSSESLEDFMNLRFIFSRINEISQQVKTIYKIYTQDPKSAKSLSTGLDFEKFVPKQEKLNLKVFFNNFSLKSTHFRHAIRITLAFLIGYGLSKITALGIGHSYWILITIVAIMRPAYSTTKYRNKLRIYGTIGGAIVAYFVLIFVTDEVALLGILLTSMIFCFSLLNRQYAWAIFFMTIYIFITFNFLKPGNVNLIFKDRLIDTFLAGIIAFLVSYFVFPIWEHTQNITFMNKSAEANFKYFEEIISILKGKNIDDEQFRIKRKNAIISLANLSDNFQRMISDPKNKQEKLEAVHQFVSTSHLITAYLASLAQYINSKQFFEEIDWENWHLKISSELQHTLSLINDNEEFVKVKVTPNDQVSLLLNDRKMEIEENEFLDIRDPKHITKLTELKNLSELLELLYEVSREQRKITENYLKIN